MSKILFSMFLMAILFSCSKDEVNDEHGTSNELPSEVYDIYGAILNPLSAIHIVINSTDTNKNCQYYMNLTVRDESVGQAIIDGCISLNSKPYEIKKDGLPSGGVVLLSQDEINAYDSFQEALLANGANGVFKFGRPMFYNDGNAAIFEMSYICGGLCGNGSIVIVEKDENVWTVKHNYLTWVSK